MARARNIKPGFFTNDDLVELPFATRLLFVGLWTLADREGRLEDRPKKIKMEFFPADDIDVDEALSTLVTSAFIQRYRVDGISVIQVTNFTKHQRPHHNESPSVLPAPPSEPTETSSPLHEKSSNDAGVSSTSHHGDKPLQPRPEALRPDTGYLNDESPSLIPDTPPPDAPAGAPLEIPAFEYIVALCEASGVDVSELSRSEREKQGAVAKRLRADGITPNDVLGCVRWLLSQSWRTGGVTLFTVEKEYGGWVILGKPATAQTKHTNGRASPGKLSNYDISAANIDAAGEPEIEYGNVIDTTWSTAR